MSSQGMFDTALQLEKGLALAFWDDECPWNMSVSLAIGEQGNTRKHVEWKGRTQRSYQSIDQRIKFSRWLEVFQALGGSLSVQNVGMAELTGIAVKHDLTIVASGKGNLGRCFDRDEKRSIFEEPQRKLACIYVRGMQPAQELPGVRVNIIPNVGEYVVMPGLSLEGHCEMMLFEALPGREFDVFDHVESAEEQLLVSKRLLELYVPWEAERSRDIQISDPQAALRGSYTPVVKHPVFRLPGGKCILGMADAVVLNDPIAGQGANSAAKCAGIYFDQIVRRQLEPFDEVWMQETFELYWQRYARASTKLSNMLLSPPAPSLLELMHAAARLPELANRLADGFDDAGSLFPWIEDPVVVRKIISEFD